jgi:hypothetical protein
VEYYNGDWICRWREEDFCDIYIVPMQPDGRISLRLTPVIALDHLTIEKVRPDEMPDATRYLAAVRGIPPENRKGRVPLPSLTPGKGPGGDQGVSVEFFTNITLCGEAELVK